MSKRKIEPMQATVIVPYDHMPPSNFGAYPSPEATPGSFGGVAKPGDTTGINKPMAMGNVPQSGWQKPAEPTRR